MSVETNIILSILHTNISDACALLNQHSEALLHATRAIELRPDWFTPNIDLAIHHVRTGRLDEAFSICLKDLQIGFANDDAIILIISRALGFLFAYGSSQNILARIERDDVVMQYWRDRSFVVMFEEIVKNPSSVKKYLQDHRMKKMLGVLFNQKITVPSTGTMVSVSKQHHPIYNALQEKKMGDAAYIKEDFKTAIRHFNHSLELVAETLSSLKNASKASTGLDGNALPPQFSTMPTGSSVLKELLNAYQRLPRLRNLVKGIRINGNEIWISICGRKTMQICITYGTQLLQENGSNEIILRAFGKAISNTVIIVEQIKKNIMGLHQNNEIGTVDRQNGNKKRISIITITLSKNQLDTFAPGYQSSFTITQATHNDFNDRVRMKNVCNKTVELICLDDDDDDCTILETNPLEDTKTYTISNHQVQQGLVIEDEVTIIAERGQVACIDYPHARHLCGIFPFGKTSHETHCSQCFCYVCDIPAPCKYWVGVYTQHCDATDSTPFWKNTRDAAKLSMVYMDSGHRRTALGLFT